MGKSNDDYAPARTRLQMTSGDAVRVARELQEMTQEELAEASGVPQPAISNIEKDRSPLGAERAEKLGNALKIYPGILLWPNWNPAGEANERERVTPASRTRAPARGKVMVEATFKRASGRRSYAGAK